MANELIKGNNTLQALLLPGKDQDLLAPLRQTILLDEVYVAGISHLEDPDIVLELKAGDPVILKREKDNAYDELAVILFDAEGRKLGYVPRRKNAVFARLMDAGKRLSGKVVQLDKRFGYPELEIAISLEDF